VKCYNGIPWACGFICGRKKYQQAAQFGPHHCTVYANAFLGPDLGSFVEWLAS
jgi:aromatic ring-cleaving dioxygenase